MPRSPTVLVFGALLSLAPVVARADAPASSVTVVVPVTAPPAVLAPVTVEGTLLPSRIDPAPLFAVPPFVLPPARPRRYAMRQNRGLILAGGITLGATYAVALVIGAISIQGTMPNASPFVPFGTIVLGGELLAAPSAYSLDIFRIYGGVLCMLDGLAQIAGTTLLIVGLTHPRRVELEDDEVARARSAVTQWAVLPFAPGSPAGLSLLLSLR